MTGSTLASMESIGKISTKSPLTISFINDISKMYFYMHGTFFVSGSKIISEFSKKPLPIGPIFVFMVVLTMVEDSGHHQEYLIKHIIFQIQNCIQLITRFSNFRIFRNSKMKDWFSTSMQFGCLDLSLRRTSERPFPLKENHWKQNLKKF